MMLRTLSLARKSSFFLPMQWMNRSQRYAMKALYQFCRLIDDIADGDDSEADKHNALDDVERQIATIFDGGEYEKIYDSLAQAIQQYGMQREYFDEMIAGMRMDMSDDMLRPSAQDLQLYCYRVAGCVGLLVLPILGHETEPAKRFAVALGHALQLTNIVRDVQVDAQMGRIYLACEWLEQTGCDAFTAEQIADNPAIIKKTCMLSIEKAYEYYNQTDKLLDNARLLRPALMMRETYKRLLKQIENDGLSYGTPYELSSISRIIGCLYALFIPDGSGQ